MNFLATRTANNAKAENSVESSVFAGGIGIEPMFHDLESCALPQKDVALVLGFSHVYYMLLHDGGVDFPAYISYSLFE